jgi:hypothetical protein
MNKSASGNSRNSRVTVVIPTSGLRKLRFFPRIFPRVAQLVFLCARVFRHCVCSASIHETCAEAGIDVNGVAAPALRTAPHQEGSFPPFAFVYVTPLHHLINAPSTSCSHCARASSQLQIIFHVQQKVLLRHVLKRPWRVHHPGPLCQFYSSCHRCNLIFAPVLAVVSFIATIITLDQILARDGIRRWEPGTFLFFISPAPAFFFPRSL